MVLLTPSDVRACVFNMCRLGEGYNPDEVDDLLDSVADTLEVLARRIEGLEKMCRARGIGIDETK